MSGISFPHVLRLPQVLSITGLSRSTLYEKIRKGELVPIKLGARAIGFNSEDVRVWIESRPSARAEVSQ